MMMIIKKHHPNRIGFTLIEIIIAIAIVAIMAGTIAPMAFQEIVRSREDATLKELANLNDALVEFYEDTGRFPLEAEGLTALVSDPGITGWQGPYVGADRSDPVTEVNTDSFKETYIYDLNPTTTPAGAADVLLVSPGADKAFTYGQLNHTWTLAGDGDDLMALVTAGQVNRDKIRECEAELEAIGEAASSYFHDLASFPVGAGDLGDDYLDAGINDTNFVDPWNRNYVFAQTGGSGSPVIFLVRSFGPDRNNDNGAGDDLTLNVSSIPPGRKASLWKLEISQTALNNDGSLVLTGDWETDADALGLETIFSVDGWAQDFEINASSRTVYSIGPDGNASLTDDNLPKGVGPESS